MLEFEDAPERAELEELLGQELADFRQDHERVLFQGEDFALGEVMPRWRIPRGVDLVEETLADVTAPAGWHLQIYARDCSEGEPNFELRCPRYYARAVLGEKGWSIDWIGRAWLARAVSLGVHWLDQHEESFPDSRVRLLSSRLYRFTSLWIQRTNKHLVVSRHPDLRKVLPEFELMGQEQLSERLVESYGPGFARGGVRERIRAG